MTGRQIGHYELRGLLGVGGMGEVYRAFDAQLRREVAVKMLPPDLTGDPDRVARFEREARVLASLNHPNIATIYGVEQSSGIRGIVMELVEGETLAERLAGTARLAVAEVLAVARQVADALDAAHEKGIVHRDLKPSNIKITPQGIVKVLDFGLATVERSNDVHAATELPGATREGMIVGTVAYMSPEQARGQAVDKRTDVWAFGCVLYEMLTGRATFAGDTPSDIVAAILSHQPDWSALPAATPAALRRLLSRCLDKDGRRRLRDIGDARTEIEDMLSGGTAGASSTSTPDRTMAVAFVREKRGRFILATALVLAVVAGFVLLRPPVAPEEFRQNEMNPPSGYSFAPLMEGGAPALSPDGSTIAYVAQGSAGRSLWVQSVDAFDARSLTGTDGAAAPFWSPDGDELAFIADGSLKTVRLDGGAPRVLVTGIPTRGVAPEYHDNVRCTAAAGRRPVPAADRPPAPRCRSSGTPRRATAIPRRGRGIRAAAPTGGTAEVAARLDPFVPVSPSQRRSSRMAASDARVERSKSVSSIRRTNVPPVRRASSQLKSAVRALPTWSWPGGAGRKPHAERRASGHSSRIERHGVGGDGLAGARGIHAFVGLALDAHLLHAAPERRGQVRADLRDYRQQFRASAITTTSTLVTATRPRAPASAVREQLHAVGALPLAGPCRGNDGRCPQAPRHPTRRRSPHGTPRRRPSGPASPSSNGMVTPPSTSGRPATRRCRS